MKTNKIQNYKYHKQFVPSFHNVTSPLMFLLTVGAIYSLFASQWDEKWLEVLFLLLVFAVMGVEYHCRMFALKAQGRAIRAEESFKYFVITGKRLPKELSNFQVIALRFAGDDELKIML